MGHHALDGILILLLLSVIAVILMRRINLPPILGYLLVGVLAGPHALGWVPEGHAVEFLAELGVVFLLFMIGLEVSIPHLMAMRTILLGLGGLQVVLSTLSTIFIAWYLVGFPLEVAFAVGGALSLSSTAIVVKQLQEQLEMHSRHGRNALGILLFQDLAVVPFLVAIPIIAGGGDAMLTAFGWAFLKAAFAFAIMFAVGHWLLRPLLHQIAAMYSLELFTLTILLLSLAAAWVTQSMGLSLALGAFLAGVMLAETEFRHQIETETRPFRDVLLGLFFVFVGTQLHIDAFLDQWHWILILTVGVILGKGGLIFALVKFSGQETGVAFRTGTVLAQGGEFGFAILTLAVTQNLTTTQEVQPILAAIVLSMAVTPLLVKYNGQWAKSFCSTYTQHRTEQEMSLREEGEQHNQHVILAGFGRVGQNLASFLREEGFDYLALDLDVTLISNAFEAGEPVRYGDTTHPEILELAGIHRASILVVTFHEARLARRIIEQARRLNPHLPIVVRTRDDHMIEELEEAGANMVIPESLETSLNVAARTLEQLNVDQDEIKRLIDKTRDGHYQQLRGVFRGEKTTEKKLFLDKQMHSVTVTRHAHGKTLAELNLTAFEVEVIAVTRDGERLEDLPESFMVGEGDVIILRGIVEMIQHAEEKILHG